jgi:hypothetical protein
VAEIKFVCVKLSVGKLNKKQLKMFTMHPRKEHLMLIEQRNVGLLHTGVTLSLNLL